MARITVEDCLAKENNRFALVQLAARRTKQLLGGAKILIPESRGNKAVVTSLREIADGLVTFMTEEERALKREQDDAKFERSRKPAELTAAETQEKTGGLSTRTTSGSSLDSAHP